MGKYLDSSGVTYLWQKIKDTFLAKADYKQNDKTTAGYVAAPGAVANKVWKTNANGEPAWRDDADTVYTHPSYTARTGKPTANATPAFGGTFTVSQITSDATGHVTNATDRTITIPNAVATASAAGLMSAADKQALSAIEKDFETMTANVIDGMDFAELSYEDGNIIHYGVCSTAAATAAKEVQRTGFRLVTGAWIAVKFTVTNTGAVANLTLNVNSTGAKNIKYRNANLSSAGVLAANRIYFFVYDGTYWQIVGDLDTNSTYTAATAAPKADALVAVVGTSAKYAREDHVHPVTFQLVGDDTEDYLYTLQDAITEKSVTVYDKNKLDSMFDSKAGNAFSTVKVGSTNLVADSTEDTLTITAGSNITLTPTANSDSFTISATNTTYTTMTQAQATAGTDTTGRLITAKILSDTIAAAQVGAALFQGAVSAASTITGAAYKKGWYWVVGTAGTYCGQVCEAGDMIYAIADKGSAYKDADFTVVQNNIDTMSTSDIDTAIAAA